MTSSLAPHTPAAASGSALPWSDAQRVIFGWYERGMGNADVQAVAGSGKTATLLGLMQRAIALNPAIRIAYVAFNRRIVEEIKTKIEPGNRYGVNAANITVNTFHGFLNSAIRRGPGSHRNTQLEEWKKHNAICGVLNHIPFEWRLSIKDLASPARFSGFGLPVDFKQPDGPKIDFTPAEWRAMSDRYGITDFMPEKGEFILPIPQGNGQHELRKVDAHTQLREWTIEYLREGYRQSGKYIDFDDMLWLPLVNAKIRPFIPKFDLVLVDEAQDLNFVRRMATALLMKTTARMIAVGDPRQAIYGFSGADHNSLELVQKQFRTTSFPLHVSYRCPRLVVARAQSWVIHIQPAGSAIEGEVLGPVDMDIAALKPEPIKTMILCRNNKPLVRIFFQLLRAGIPAIILGQDIAKRMEKTIKAAVTLADRMEDYRAGDMLCVALSAALDSWEEEQTAMWTKENKPWKVDELKDLLGGIRLVLSECSPKDSTDVPVGKIRAMFTDEEGKRIDRVVLCSIHKSKGLEADQVIWFGANKYQPNKFAKRPEELQQEYNLMYVAATRAQRQLIEVNEMMGEGE